MSFSEKCRLIGSDPVTCSRYFDNRIRLLFKHLFFGEYGPFVKAGYKITDYYWRTEFQTRGSPHVHGLLWIENAPIYDKFESNSINECTKFIDKLITCENNSKYIE